MFRFREIKTEERNLNSNFNPDERIAPLTNTNTNAPSTESSWNEIFNKKFVPDPDERAIPTNN